MPGYNKYSFLKNAGTLGKYLDVNKLPRLSVSSLDEQYTIQPDIHQRPDILAHKLYGNSRLFWVFALRNPDILIDPINDFKEGLEITLPSAETVKKIGG